MKFESTVIAEYHRETTRLNSLVETRDRKTVRLNTMIETRDRALLSGQALLAHQTSTIASHKIANDQLKNEKDAADRATANIRALSSRESENVKNAHRMEVAKLENQINSLKSDLALTEAKWKEHWRIHYKAESTQSNPEVNRLQEQLKQRNLKMGELQKEKEAAVKRERDEKEKAIRDLDTKIQKAEKVVEDKLRARDVEKSNLEAQLRSSQNEGSSFKTDFEAILGYIARLRTAVGLPTLPESEGRPTGSVLRGSLEAITERIAGKMDVDVKKVAELEAALTKAESEMVDAKNDKEEAITELNDGWKSHETSLKKRFHEQFEEERQGRLKAEKKLKDSEEGSIAEALKRLEESERLLREKDGELVNAQLLHEEALKGTKREAEESAAKVKSEMAELQSKLLAAEEAKQVYEARVSSLEDQLEEAETARNVSPVRSPQQPGPVSVVELSTLLERNKQLEDAEKEKAEAENMLRAQIAELETQLANVDQGRIQGRTLLREKEREIQALKKENKVSLFPW
jgi:chromosome segregation ATPase